MYQYEYPRMNVAVDIVVALECQGKCYVLLIQRGKEPFKDKWAFPGGFVNMDETLKAAADRELLEETGLSFDGVDQLELAFVADGINRDPRGRTLGVVFSTGIYRDTLPEVKGMDDAVNARWVDVSLLSEEELAFDHNKIFEKVTICNIVVETGKTITGMNHHNFDME